ncbi:MAG: tRNA lysidine(34) synthetase TilS [Prevotellaceae bacterium]|nr:tRNA lysidine(34) synthetase TilS [Prevotellaceae bacterium]
MNKLRSYIAKHDLLSLDGKYLVALSGGADSVALLLMLTDIGYKVEAAHCNFHLRGDESNRDEKFVRELCERLNIPLHTTSFDTLAYSREKKISIEMAARDLRYDYFLRVKTEIKADAICIAHHKDDIVETVLINLIRGTGIKGLTGIRPKNGDIVRPLLCLDKSEILSYLHQRHQTYVTDSTNLVPDVVRNKLRLNVIPMLKEINPAFVDNVVRMADNITDAIAGTAENELFNILSVFGFNGKQTRQIADVTQSGKIFTSAAYELLVDRDKYIISRRQTADISSSIDSKISGESGFSLITTIIDIDETFSVPRDKCCACLDADLVNMPVTLRQVQTGDKFVPFGMKGKKLVSDFLTDIKMPLTDKRRQLVAIDSTGEILWVVNQRPDNRYRITDKTTKALLLSVES